MSAAAAKRTALAATSLLALIALTALVPAGGASSERDHQAPSTPRNLRVVSATPALVSVAWEASSDDVGVAGYYVFGDKGKATVEEPAYTLTELGCGQSTLLTVVAFDDSQNRSEKATLTVATAACLDTEPPAPPSGFTQLATSQDAVVLGWKPALDNTGVVAYGVYRDLQRVASPVDPNVTLSGLSCGATVAYAVDAVDAAGNHSARASVYVRTAACSQPPPPPPSPPPPGDTISPSTPSGLAASAVTQTSLSLTWNASSDNVQVTGYDVYRNGTKVASSSATSVAQAGLACGSAYQFAVAARDAAGNTSPRAQLTASTSACATPPPAPPPPPPPADTTPPSVPSGLRVSSASATSVSLTWNPASDNVAVVGYRTYVDRAYAATSSQPGATLSGLRCGTAYTFEVDAFDAEGNASARAAITGSTAACQDTQAPSPPSGIVTSSRTQTSIALTWSASSDDVAVTGYGLYRNGTQVATSSTTSGIFAGLACNTNYTLAIDAYDAAGNHSAKSTLLVSTTACPDMTAPSPPSGLAVSNISQTALTLTWTAATDNVAVTGYDVYRDGVKVASPSASPSAQASLTCGTSYTFAVEALDAAGNRSARASVSAATSACASPATWTWCANEYQRCAFTGTKEVRYGANATFTAPRTFADGVDCTNAIFGDPLVGTPKHCEVLSSGSALLPPPPAPGGTQIPSNGVITQAGTYSGSYTGTVQIATTAPVTLSNARITNTSGGTLINAVGYGPVQVTLEHVTGIGGASYQTSGRFFVAENFKSVTIRNCSIENTTGIELDLGAAGSSVLITRNKHHNIQGNGTSPVGNFIQFRSVRNSTVEVSWNEVLNEYNKSNPEDLISLYQSANAKIHDNYFFGQSTPGNAYASSSQNGITIESGTEPGSASNNVISNNQVIAGEAIGMFSGNNNMFQGNRIVRSGFLTDGTTLNRNGYEGIWISTNGSNNRAQGNVVGYINRDGARSDGRLLGAPGGDAAEWANNTHMPGPISLAVEQNEWTLWQQKLAANGISLGA